MQWMEGEWPDIVLADVDIPEVDGYALAAHVKQSPRLKGVPVLLLAGAFEPVDQRRADQIGCEGVLIKPFEPQQLVTRVRELLSRPRPGANGRDRMAASERTPSEVGNVTPFPTGGAKTMDSGMRGSHAMLEIMSEVPETLEVPDRPVWDLGLPDVAGTSRPAEASAPAAPPAQKVSLVSAFSALLAAEQSATPAPVAGSTPVTEATVEDAVRRVLAKMTDDLVRKIVLETAERLIKEEIEKIKTMPD
jgi:CheY-like chemotaxis protein